MFIHFPEGLWRVLEVFLLAFLVSTISVSEPKNGPHSTVSNMSDCRSRAREFDQGPVQYFCGD